MRVLIAEDEVGLAKGLKFLLEKNNFTVDIVHDGVDALACCDSVAYDAVILDIMMPELDGFSACKKIKAIRNVPIIMLSARQEEDDKLFSFEMGVDDYVSKPFSQKELMARIKAVCERYNLRENARYVFAGLIIDVDGRSVSVDGKKVTLTPKELDLLIYLVENKNIALGRDKLLSAVWDTDYYEDDRTIDTHIKMLRKDLGPYAFHIVTVRGMGYKFEV